MDLADLLNYTQIVELRVTSRPAAMRALVQAIDFEDDTVSTDAILAAIEEREATAQTIVADGFAMPHCGVAWDGDFRVVLGRSRIGINFSVPESPKVRLIALLVVGKRLPASAHFDILASLNDALDGECRRVLTSAPDSRAIEKALYAKAGVSPETRRRRRPSVPRLNAILAEQAIDLADSVDAQALLVTVNRSEHVPWDVVREWHGPLLVVTSEVSEGFVVDRPGTHFFEVPQGLTRMDRANLGILLAASAGILKEATAVVCLTGGGGRELDGVTVVRPEAQIGAMFSASGSKRAYRIRPEVILRTLVLAVELAIEGREGKAIGAMFTVGDSRQVMSLARQLVLNPFHGYSHSLRNLLDPSLAETIKEFAAIDGAFIVRRDGVVLCAGAYLVPKKLDARLPPGLGTRHQAAAAVSAQTRATVIVVSQSTGTVTVFRGGKIVFKLERSTPTRL